MVLVAVVSVQIEIEIATGFELRLHWREIHGKPSGRPPIVNVHGGLKSWLRRLLRSPVAVFV